MLLAIDIGNTNIVIGIFTKNILEKKWRIATDTQKTEDEYALIFQNLLKTQKIDKAIFSSVVPRLNNTFTKLINKYYNINPLNVSSKLYFGIKIKYALPDEIGADRLVNAAAAVHLYKPPMIIIDFGTATTFCYVDKNKNYYGGLILPGIPILLKALHQGTAQLPEVEIKDIDWVIGNNTIESIQAGIFHQTVGSIDYIIDLIKKKYDKTAKIIITGGLGKLFYKKIKHKSIFDVDLTLKGLNIIYHLN